MDNKDLFDKLNDFILQNNLDNQVIFLGARTDISLLLNIANVAVLPSLWEGFPNALLEAMACERPVVASDVSDNSVLIKEGKNGFLFESDNHQQLAEALLKLIHLDYEKIIAMGKYSRNIVESEFTVEKLVERTCALYD